MCDYSLIIVTHITLDLQDVIGYKQCIEGLHHGNTIRILGYTILAPSLLHSGWVGGLGALFYPLFDR